MSMFASGVNRSLRDIRSADQAATTLGRELSTGKKIQTPADDASTWLEAGRSASAASYLDAIHTGLNEVATNIRVVGTTMQAIGQNLDTMQGLVEQALHYAAGSTDRQQLIASFNTVRQQIDQIVNTTSEPGARNLMSDPAVNGQAGDIQVVVGVNGEVKTVHGQQVDTGPNGLNIPGLAAAATDAALQAALAGLSTAQSTLAARSQALGADTADISRYDTRNTGLSSLYASQMESLTGADPAAAAAELQSVNVQRSLAVETLASVSTLRNAVLELLQ